MPAVHMDWGATRKTAVQDFSSAWLCCQIVPSNEAGAPALGKTLVDSSRPTCSSFQNKQCGLVHVNIRPKAG